MSLVGVRTLENLIGGDLLPPAGGDYLECLNPATGELLARVPESGAEDLERAVAAAQKAAPEWKALGPEGRGKLLHALADLLDDNQDEFVEAEVDDNGMTRRFAAGMEVPRGAANLRSFAQAAHDFCGRRPFEAPHARGYVLHQSVDVVGTISPWNLPLLSLTWKIAPALAAGSCVVAKPSEVTPLTAYLLSALLEEAGWPPGVLNIVHGSGAGIGSLLCEHPAVERISFTGSTATGKLIGEACARNFKRPPMLEMGGKNPTIVFADADFDKAVEGVAKAAFANQGQVCLCGSRIYIEESLYERFRDALVERANGLKIGDPQDLKTAHGASISSEHLKKIESYVALAKEEGGTILCGGERAQLAGRCDGGSFYKPTLVEGLPVTARTNQEEIFGPVATVAPFRSESQAVEWANNSCYGLSASIWSEDLDKATRVADALETGMPWINCWNLRVLETPFGGFKNSGNGHREGVPDAMEFFTEKKTVIMPVS